MALIPNQVRSQYYLVKEVYPSQAALLAGAGAGARLPYSTEHPGTVLMGFKTGADYARAQSLTNLNYAHAYPVINKFYWVVNPDIPKLQAGGVPFNINLSGRVFTRILIVEWELWKPKVLAMGIDLIEKTIDPNTVVDPSLTLSTSAIPDLAPAPAPTAAPTPAQAAPTELHPPTLPYADELFPAAAAQPQGPVTIYPTSASPFDVPQLAPKPAAPAPAPAGGAGTVAGFGALIMLLLMGKK